MIVRCRLSSHDSDAVWGQPPAACRVTVAFAQHVLPEKGTLLPPLAPVFPGLYLLTLA
jgi:hypothetical protein